MNTEAWYKSSYSTGGNANCVECRTEQGRVLIRDSKSPTLGHLTFPAAEWRALLATVRDGEL